MNRKEIVFRIERYDPERGQYPRLQRFAVPFSEGMTVLNALFYIKENLDSTVTFRTSCRMGICGSCAVMVNDYPHLACNTQVKDLRAGTLTLKPLPNFPVIKDLVVDLNPMFEKHRLVKPYVLRRDAGEMTRPTAEFSQTPAEMSQFLQFACCIKCGICIAACPTCATDKRFLGPQALAQAYRYCADSRDDGEAERLSLVEKDHGVWHCHLAGACAESCPKGVDPALAIQLLKRSVIAGALRLKKGKIPAPVTPAPAETKPKILIPPFTAVATEKNEGRTSA